MIFNALTFIGAVGLLYLTFKVYRFQTSLKYLRDVEYAGGRRWPVVSLIVPACNERETIQAALESLQKLNYPNYEIIVVNDRSTDGTGDIIKQLAAEDSRIKTVDVENLPNGWLGKVHALHMGIQKAQGEWLLLSDADVVHSPDALKKAVAYSEENQIDLLTAAPDLIAKTFALKAFLCHLLHHGSMATDRQRIENPNYSNAIGVGAFSLVRPEWIQKIGGLEAIRLDVIDDGALAYMIKKAGGRNTFLAGTDELTLEWYKDLPALVRGLEKNGFAIFGYSLAPLIGVSLVIWVGFFITFIAPFFVTSPDVRSFYLMSLILYFMMSGLSLKKGSNMPAWYALTLPFTLFFSPIPPLRSALLCLKNGGITWRGTFYPLFLIKREQKFVAFDMVRGRS